MGVRGAPPRPRLVDDGGRCPAFASRQLQRSAACCSATQAPKHRPSPLPAAPVARHRQRQRQRNGRPTASAPAGASCLAQPCPAPRAARVPGDHPDAHARPCPLSPRAQASPPPSLLAGLGANGHAPMLVARGPGPHGSQLAGLAHGPANAHAGGSGRGPGGAQGQPGSSGGAPKARSRSRSQRGESMGASSGSEGQAAEDPDRLRIRREKNRCAGPAGPRAPAEPLHQCARLPVRCLTQDRRAQVPRQEDGAHQAGAARAGGLEAAERGAEGPGGWQAAA